MQKSKNDAKKGDKAQILCYNNKNCAKMGGKGLTGYGAGA